MTQAAATMPPNSPPPSAPPVAPPRWRQRLAGVLLLVGGIALLASYFLPWSSGSQVPGRDTCLTCTPDVFNNTAWQIINPLAVRWGNTFVELAQGDVSFLQFYTIAAFMQLVVPVAFVYLGGRLLTRATAVRLPWQVLVLLYCPLELYSARALQDITTWDSLVPLSPAVGYYLAVGAVIGFFTAGLLMPHVRRRLRSHVGGQAS